MIAAFVKIASPWVAGEVGAAACRVLGDLRTVDCMIAGLIGPEKLWRRESPKMVGQDGSEKYFSMDIGHFC